MLHACINRRNYNREKNQLNPRGISCEMVTKKKSINRGNDARAINCFVILSVVCRL